MKQISIKLFKNALQKNENQYEVLDELPQSFNKHSNEMHPIRCLNYGCDVGLKNYLSSSDSAINQHNTSQCRLNHQISYNGSNNLLSEQNNSKKLISKPTRFPVIFFALYLMYLIVGAVIMQYIEMPMEKKLRSELANTKRSFLIKNPQVKEDELDEFLSVIVAAKNRGLWPAQNASDEMNWSFGEAFFFTGTLLTTIGYGTVTPSTEAGKIFCMFYAFIGIPLTFIFINFVAQKLLHPAKCLLNGLYSRFGHLCQPLRVQFIHLSLIILIVAIVFFFIPTFIFTYLEPNWNKIEAFYYCFTSLTKIGFGDFVPGEGFSDIYKTIYKISLTGYLLLGLIAIRNTVTLFNDIPQLNLQNFS